MDKKEIIFGFEKLDIWQISMSLSIDIKKLTKTFPKEEIFQLTSQVNRSSASIPSNIAESTGRLGGKDKARFIEIAYSSALETINHLIQANKMNYISNDELNIFRERILEIINKLNKYHSTIQKQKNPKVG
jgi:four helix bundle protein